MWTTIIGQSEAVRALQGALATGRLSHAYLFYGPDGTGKARAALELAKAINCQAGGDEACEQCLSCRQVAHGNHPDTHILRPGSAKGENISIEQLREDVIADSALRPVAGRRKVYVIPDAHRLSHPAFHTLLKVLEEPPAYATLILTAPDLADMLPTVVSRCQRVRFRPEPPGFVADALQARGVEPGRAAFLDAYSEGRIGLALSLAEDPVPLARRGEVLDWAQALPRATRGQCLRLAEDLVRISAAPMSKESGPSDPDAEAAEGDGRAAKGDMDFSLEVLASWTRDALMVREAGAAGRVRNIDRQPELQAWAQSYARDQLSGILEALLRARYALERNCIPRLVVETLVLGMIR